MAWRDLASWVVENGDGPGKRLRARAGLAVLAAGIAACLFFAWTPDPEPRFPIPRAGTCDVDLYRRIVARVGSGESYYDAAHQELRALGFPTRSMFNWRTPIYAWFLGGPLGTTGGRWLLMAGVAGALWMTCRDAVDDRGLLPGSAGGVALVGSMAWCVGSQTYLFSEVWAGMMIALSVSFSRRGWTAAAVASGVFALFYRELVLPYTVVALGLAVWNGRKREAVAWALGLLAFALFMAGHATQVLTRLTPADSAMHGTWVRFGGLRFVLLTAQANLWLMALPLACTAVFLPFAALGLLHAPGESGLRVRWTAGLYLAAFCVVGFRFNFYWGFINAPLLAIGIAHAPAALGGLLRNAFTRRERSPTRFAGVPAV